MWKRIGLELARVLGVALILAAGYNIMERARAGVACSVPFTFVNGTTADATQVNSNFNSLVTCLSNAAAAGVNSDITQLAGLTTPLAAGSGGTNNFTATAVPTGTANAMVIASTIPNSFTLTTGYSVSFVYGFANNSAATTLNVNGLGAQPIKRKTQLGALATVGGELFGGGAYRMTWDGSQFILEGETFYVGEVKDYIGSLAAPPGFVIAAGQQISRTGIFASLFAVLGTTCGAGDGSTTFNICDYRGTVLAGLDNQNGTARNLLTNAATGCGTTMNGFGGQCANGAQNHTLSQAELPVFSQTPTFTGTGQTWNINQSVLTPTGALDSMAGGDFARQSSTVTVTVTPAGTISAVTFGSGNAHPVVQPTAAVLKMVRY